MKKLLFGLALMLPIFLSAQQVAKSLTAPNGQLVGFYEYKPTDYNANPSTTYPLIIFLHGIGERGDGVSTLSYVLGQGIPRYINEGHPMTFTYNGQTSTFLVLSPQLNAQYGSWQNFYVDELLKYATQNLRVDPSRIYLTGLSLGGGGTWKYASASPENAKKFAAIAPVCATAEYSSLCNLMNNNVAVWAFHALDDGIVGVGGTQNAMSILASCTQTVPAKVTYYPTGSHFIWDWAYDRTHAMQSPLNLFEWFLSYKRNGTTPPPPPNNPPIAIAGADQAITLPASTANLNGSASNDPGGSITAYSWTQVSGPNTASINSGASANTSVSGLVAGTYVFRLRVTDNGGGVATDDVQIVVSTAVSGTTAVALAGADQTITLPLNGVYLMAGGSFSQGGGSINSWSWSQVSGPNQATIRYTSPTNGEAQNLVAGSYVFRLTVTNTLGSVGTDECTINVNPAGGGTTNVAPVANAGTNKTITLPTNSVTMNGSATDADGTIASYAWAKTSGPANFSITNGSTPTPIMSGLAAGTYVFTMTVTDNNGAAASSNVQVVVNGTTTPPPTSGTSAVALAGADVTITLPTNGVYLMAGGSFSQGGGSINSWTWSQVSGPSQAGMRYTSPTNLEASNLIAGVYTFRLTVTNTLGATGTDDVNVTVNGAGAPANVAPVANAGTNKTITLPTNSVTMNGSATDANGTIASYAWAKTSGPASFSITNGSTPTPIMSGLAAGTYVFTMTVTDNQGATASSNVQVVVNGTTTPPPTSGTSAIALAGADASITLPTNGIYLFGGGSFSQGGGSINTWTWSQVSGPSQAGMRYTSPTNLEASNLIAGVYTFRLTVTNTLGATGTDDVNVTVNGNGTPAANVPPVANAGSNKIIALPTNSVTMNGSATDADGTVTGINWAKSSGPANFSITNGNTPTPIMSGLAAGTYVFTMTATDNYGAAASSNVQVVVNGTTPPPTSGTSAIALAGADASITLPTNGIYLYGGGSFSQGGGSINTWTWSQVSGPSQAGMRYTSPTNLEASNLVAGVYTFRLTVTNTLGATGTDEVRVTVNSALGTVQAPVSTPALLDNTATPAAGLTTYPNPVISTLTVEINNSKTGTIQINFIDAAGRVAKTLAATKTSTLYKQQVDVQGLIAGTYVVEIRFADGSRLTNSILKQ